MVFDFTFLDFTNRKALVFSVNPSFFLTLFTVINAFVVVYDCIEKVERIKKESKNGVNHRENVFNVSDEEHICTDKNNQ